MNNSAIGRFLLRWFVCSLGLWVAAGLLGSERLAYNSRLRVIVVSGLILAIINTILKPIVVILSLPAILFSLGLFMVVINGLMVLLASYFYTSLHVKNLGTAIVAGIVIGLVNYIVSAIFDKS